MFRWKILIMVILYIMLGVVAYFNFGFHHILIERFGEKSAFKELDLEEPEKKTESNQTEAPLKFQEPSFEDQ